MAQTFRNRSALFLWVFMTCWMAMLVAFTGVFLRDGSPQGTPPLLMIGVLGLFWIFGLGGSAWAASKPLVSVEVLAAAACTSANATRWGWSNVSWARATRCAPS